MPTILFITSNNAIRGGLQSVFSLKNWRVSDVPTGSMGAKALRGSVPDAVVVDQTLPDCPGIELVEDAKRMADANGQEIVIAALVEQVDRSTAVDFVKAGANLFLARPVDLADAYNRIAELVDDAEPLEPMPPSDDPLAKPMLVIASPSMNVRDTVIKALGDEFEYLHFDGGSGIGAAKRKADVILVDEGLPGVGLEALPSMRALFGEAVGVGLAARGVEPPPGFVHTLTKPLRVGAAKRHLRAAAGVLLLGTVPMETGVIVRLRDGWHEYDEERFADLKQQLSVLTSRIVETGRRWVCLTGQYLGAKDQIHRARDVVQASTHGSVKTGVVTVLSNTVRVAHELRLPPPMVQQSAHDFIKLVQELV